MDLDKLKESWQKTEVKPTMDEPKIQRIINQQGKSAFNSLLNTEKIGLIALIACIPLSFAFGDLLCTIIYIASALCGIGWQIYKYKFLKEIHPAEMPLLKIAEKIITYKKYLVKEIYIGGVWAIGFILLWIMRVIAKDLIRRSPDHTFSITVLIVVFVGMVAFIGLFVGIMYKFLYLNKIRTIDKAIEEAEEVADFEKDEQK